MNCLYLIVIQFPPSILHDLSSQQVLFIYSPEGPLYVAE